jgi:methionyl-tRNA formyltransferase
MTKTSKKIVFFGNERLATGVTTTVPVLRGLLEAGYDIAAVISNFQAGQSRSARSLEIAGVAEEHGIPLLLPEKPADIKETLAGYQADAGVLVAYGRIVPEPIINLFPGGIINLHPSLLPLHRGPTPIESVLLNGETQTGASIMKLVKAMDAGPVYAQGVIPVKDGVSKQELCDRLLLKGRDLLLDTLPVILSGELTPLPQNDALATYDNLIKKEDGTLDWNKPAERLEGEVRAYAEWPKSRTTLAGKEVVITKAHAAAAQQAGCQPGDVEAARDKRFIMICTGQGSLAIERLKPAGKPEMTAQAFLAGNKLY